MIGPEGAIIKVAFATWNNRIAPQFDAAGHVCLVETKMGAIIHAHLEAFRTKLPVKKVCRLVELGVDTLVCGAISRPVQALVEAQGIRVVALVAGELSEVINAWIKGGLDESHFTMPGSRDTEW
ncbi:MAG: NifB/NifX family molybdenum-iron cluster-binding protein [Desulfobacterales bacterium]|nr:NifB/NifX family molybdenum-iron cluster-binding protein [Desulfobacterales bacterium]MBI5896922.1 NifB/NifX family molybdenum-iron cluster-binding protein [Desulfobacterales bacterium]